MQRKGGGGVDDDCWWWFRIAVSREHISFSCQPTYGAPTLLATYLLMTFLSAGVGVSLLLFL